MKIVLDTSVWIAAVLSRRGASHELLRRVLQGTPPIVVSHAIYNELAEVLSRPEIRNIAKIRPHELKAIMRFLRHLRVPVTDKTRASRDPNDDMFIQCAVEYGAGHVISLDKDLLSVKTVHGIVLLSPGDFLRLMNGGIKT